MQGRLLRFLCCLALGTLGYGTTGMAQEDSTARLKEMLHRTQEALRQAQSENADLSRAKSDAEQKLKAAIAELEAAQSSSKSNAASAASLHTKLSAAEGAQNDLMEQITGVNQQMSATGKKLNETTKQLMGREAELTAAKQAIEQSKTATASCENKNLKLYTYAEELLTAYRRKGVWAALEQKDPVLGLKEVEIENVVQAYRLKIAREKINPADKPGTP